MLQNVEWGEYEFDKLFTSSNGNFDIQKCHINNTGNYVITAGLTNNGILGRSDISAKLFDKGTITIDMFGNAFYRHFKYKMVTHARVFSLKPIFNISFRQGLFLANAMKFLKMKFGYDNMCSWDKIKFLKISLPVKNGEIDLSFMENFISKIECERMNELGCYLRASGLSDYELTNKELKAIQDFGKGTVVFNGFAFDDIFNKIAQGRRLRKEDQQPGEIPFVMSGVANTGVVNYVSNPVAFFPKNSITIDIFGNTFYREYSFGAGDDTGVYWNDEKEYSKNLMLFFAAAMSKFVNGKYFYGHKLRSSQSLKFKMMLPLNNGNPDFCLMETLISAVQKLVIKDIVLYSKTKILQKQQDDY